MTDSRSFSDTRKFHALEHFPRGLDRSGEFTREQAQLLVNHGFAYQALDAGTREPATEDERQFVAVCRGEREPLTPHEKAWSCFCRKTRAPRRGVPSPMVLDRARGGGYSGASTDFDL